MISVKELCEWIVRGGKVALFCAGQNGFAFYKILQLVGITVDCFVDNNKEKWGQAVYENVCCYSPEILKENEKYITFICIAPNTYREIRCQAELLNIVRIEDMSSIIKDIIHNYQEVYIKLMRELPYGKSSELFFELYPNVRLAKRQRVESCKEEIAVYTSIFGEYDTVWEPKYLSENVDYYFVSEKKPEKLEVYKWVDAKKVLPAGIEGNVKKNRYVKMHPHLIFPEYRYSIYVDGNVQILDDVSDFVQRSKTGISVFMHPWRDDIFLEALAIVNSKRAKFEEVYEQVIGYLKEGMPFDYGMAEMRVIAREHNNPICIKIMEDWWKEFERNPFRDQLSYMYAMWKNSYKLSDMFLLGINARECEKVCVREHIKGKK